MNQPKKTVLLFLISVFLILFSLPGRFLTGTDGGNQMVFAQDKTSDAPATVARPNIILILADDLGWSDPGCFGGEIATPNLDRLAREGVRFTQFYTTPRCCPSRASINTGLYPHEAGIGCMTGNSNRPGYEGYLTDRCVTTAELLKQAGYRTYLSGKWHMNPKSGPLARGFDEFFGLLTGHSSSSFNPAVHKRLPPDRPVRTYPKGEYYATDVFTDYALDFLADSRKPAADGSRPPFFLYLPYTAPHFPLHARPEDIKKYADVYTKGWDEIRQARLERQKQLGLLPDSLELPTRSLIPSNWANEKTGWGEKDNPAWNEIPEDRQKDLARRMAIFAAMVDRMDQNIGRILNDLEKHGDLDNTLILFLSDNGACAEWDPWGFDRNSGPFNILHKGAELDKMGGQGTYHSVGSGWANVSMTPWRLYKHYIHEGGIRTPLIAYWPNGIKEKNAIDAAVGHVIDFAPTFLELAGAQYPAREGLSPLRGQSMVPRFQGITAPDRTLFWEHENNLGIRDGKWKLVKINTHPNWELYDMEADPVEMNDLVNKYPDRVNQMAEQWRNWARKSFVRK